MALIREWTITIISVIIFVTFIEILIPNSNHKRYINVVVGFLLIIVILTPLTRLISGQINLEDEILRTFNQLELSTAQNRINNIEHSNHEAVIALYKSEISNHIKSHIDHSTDYSVKQIQIEVEDDSYSTDFGLIKTLDITLEENKDGGGYRDKTVEPILINVSAGKKNNNTVEASSILINNEGDEIRNYIRDTYKLAKEDINIYILRNN